MKPLSPGTVIACKRADFGNLTIIDWVQSDEGQLFYFVKRSNQTDFHLIKANNVKEVVGRVNTPQSLHVCYDQEPVKVLHDGMICNGIIAKRHYKHNCVPKYTVVLSGGQSSKYYHNEILSHTEKLNEKEPFQPKLTDAQNKYLKKAATYSRLTFILYIVAACASVGLLPLLKKLIGIIGTFLISLG